jgi:formate hydrogenlyase subunit 6/NADH:ubiquinone oxidoreductase subunit I
MMQRLISFIKIFRRALFLLFTTSEITERYPHNSAKKVLPKRYKGVLAVDIKNCTLCGICSRVCPTNAILVYLDKDMLEIDFTKCVYCSYCQDECPEKAILFSKKFENASFYKKTFKYRFNILSRRNFS